MCIPKMPVIMSLIDVNYYCMNDKIYRITALWLDYILMSKLVLNLQFQVFEVSRISLI